MTKINIQKQRLIDTFSPDNEFNTFENLLNYCNCSIRTLRRKIKQMGLLVSYNHNSKFYTLPSIPVFNEQGIWYKKGVCFSIHGSLVKTVNKIVADSKAGYTAAELSCLLHVRVNDLLRVQTKKQALKREKMGGAYVYYNTDEQCYAMQCRERQSHLNSLILQDVTSVLNNQAAVIAILTEFILSHKQYPKMIAQRLKNKSLDISIGQIQEVISHFGLKKTMDKS